MRCALSIAGSDSIGGAGIQADIKAMAAVGVHAHTVITAITAQNTCSVNRIMPVPADMILDQLDAVLSDSDVRAMKTGMLYSGEIVRTVAERLEYRQVPLVVDPVLVAGVGDSLAADDLVSSLKRDLMPICDIITPNRYEAETLTGMKIHNEDDARRACELLGKEGTTVYLKGGHMDSRNVVDTLYNGAEFMRFEYPRLERAGHGGGCTLSSYITAHLAKGVDAINSIMESREMMQQSIASMYSIGKGDKLVNPLVKMKNDSDRSRILDDVNDMADRLIRIIPKEWVPREGLDIAYASSSAKGREDVASIKGRMTSSNGRIRKNGPAAFGVSERMSSLILNVMKHDANQRAAVNMTCNLDLMSIMEEVGMSGVVVEGKKSMGEMISYAVRKNGSVPDVLMHVQKQKDGGSVIIFGRDPKDLTDKIDSIL